MARRKLCGVWIGWTLLLVSGCRIDPGAFDDVEQGSDGQLHYRWNEGDSQLDLFAKGELVFSDDFTDLKSLSPEGSFFRLEESSGGTSRKYEVKLEAESKVVRVFFVDGQPRAVDDPALHEWLASTLPRVLRETAFQAVDRVHWLLQEGGVEAVLQEVSKIDSGTSRAIYLDELVENDALSEKDLLPFLREARKVTGDGDLSRLLQAVSTKSGGNHAVTMGLIQACDQLRSSGERRQVVERIAEERDIDAEAAIGLAQAVEGMRSDSERAQAILRVAERSPRDAQVAVAFLDVASAIRSSSEKSRVFRELIGRPGLSDAVLAKAANGIATISASSEKALALVRVAEVTRPQWNESLSAFFEATATVESVGEQERVLSSFVARDDLKPETLQRTLSFVKAHLPEGPLRQRLIDRIERKLAGA